MTSRIRQYCVSASSRIPAELCEAEAHSSSFTSCATSAAAATAAAGGVRRHRDGCDRITLAIKSRRYSRTPVRR